MTHRAGVSAPPLLFADKSSSIPRPKRYGNYGALWGDFNNDSLIDLVFPGHGSNPMLLAQKHDRSFTDVTLASGLKTSDWDYSQQKDRHGGSCADFNNDGKLDLFIAHGAQRGETLSVKYDELLKGDGDFTFTDITRQAGTLNQSGRGRSGIWFDYNKDGWVDLFVLNYRSNNVLYENNGDSTFTNVTEEVGLSLSRSQAVPVDVDQDGNIDLLLSWPLTILRNDGSGRFTAASKLEFKYTGKFGYGLALGDADNDGDLDIFVSRIGMNGMLLVNENGTFRRLNGRIGDMPKDTLWTGATWGDIDNDGLLDLVTARSDGYFIYRNTGNLTFSVTKLDTRSPSLKKEKNGDIALADFNGDGLLDIASDDVNGHFLLQNMNSSTNGWLKIQFRGTNNNRLGFGNKIWVTSGGNLVAYREYTGSAGSLRSVSCNPLHIGLAQNSEVDVRVQWLDGTITTLHDVAANQVLTIVENEGTHSGNARSR